VRRAPCRSEHDSGRRQTPCLYCSRRTWEMRAKDAPSRNDLSHVWICGASSRSAVCGWQLGGRQQGAGVRVGRVGFDGRLGDGVGAGAEAAAMPSPISRLHVLLSLSNPAASTQACTACHRSTPSCSCSTQSRSTPHPLLFAAIAKCVPARTLR
jgi:hypothetical protein